MVAVQGAAAPGIMSSSSQLGVVFPGAAAALPLVLFGYPFDTVKTRLQLCKNINRNLGMIECVREIAAKEGLLSFYRGSSVSLSNLASKLGLELS
jgi:hypothetical protein